MVKGEEFCSTMIPSKFAKFGGFLGLPMVGFEKEIIALLKKMELIKGHGVKVLRGSRKSLFSRLEREIQKLECSVNYNGTLLAIRWRRGAMGVKFSHSKVAVLFSLLVCGFRRAFG